MIPAAVSTECARADMCVYPACVCCQIAVGEAAVLPPIPCH